MHPVLLWRIWIDICVVPFSNSLSFDARLPSRAFNPLGHLAQVVAMYRYLHFSSWMYISRKTGKWQSHSVATVNPMEWPHNNSADLIVFEPVVADNNVARLCNDYDKGTSFHAVIWDEHRYEYKVAGLLDPKNKAPPLSPREALCLFRWCFIRSAPQVHHVLPIFTNFRRKLSVFKKEVRPNFTNFRQEVFIFKNEDEKIK